MGLADWWYVLKTTRLSKPAEDRALFQATRNQSIASVLDLRIEDGQRCARLLRWLAFHNTTPRHYAVIDMFEAAGHLSLKQFHSQMVAQAIKPLPVPGTLATGLPRVAHTIGAVDLLILDQAPSTIDDPSARVFLPRVIHPNSIILAPSVSTGFLGKIEHASFLQALSSTSRAAA